MDKLLSAFLYVIVSFVIMIILINLARIAKNRTLSYILAFMPIVLYLMSGFFFYVLFIKAGPIDFGLNAGKSDWTLIFEFIAGMFMLSVICAFYSFLCWTISIFLIIYGLFSGQFLSYLFLAFIIAVVPILPVLIFIVIGRHILAQILGDLIVPPEIAFVKNVLTLIFRIT